MDETFHFLCSALSLEACVPAYMDSAFYIRSAESQAALDLWLGAEPCFPFWTW